MTGHDNHKILLIISA